MHTFTKQLPHLRLRKHFGNWSSKIIRFRVTEKLTQNCIFLVTSEAIPIRSDQCDCPTIK